MAVTALSAMALTIAAVAGPAAFGGSAAQASTLPVSYDFLAQATATALAPQTPPPGANDFGCKPSAAHPYPVVLVHGTFANMDDNWQTASPLLVNHGYCVFAFNYGGVSPSSPIQGTGDIAAGAAVLASFVNTVLADTGASKVDLVGHSQGGMMPRYYINFLGGADKVAAFVGLAPSNYGTTLDGLTTAADLLGAGSLVSSGLSGSCEACAEQEQGSAFLSSLNATPTQPGVSYTVIESRDDEVVTPYTNAFLPDAPNVTNITLQNQCSLDQTDHVEIASDPVAMADMLNALDPAYPVPVPCVVVLPLTGPPGPVPAFLSGWQEPASRPMSLNQSGSCIITGMRLSARADYALRAAIELASAQDGHVTAEQLAQAQNIPGKFLETILTHLRRSGLVRSQRGPDGGFWLARPATEISLADIIRAIDGQLLGVRGERPENISYPGAAEPLQRVWIALRANERAVLETVTLQDIVAGKLPEAIEVLIDSPNAWI
jgi:Rrf2 family protein